MEKSLVQQAFDILEPIPEEEFITVRYSNKIDKCCAMGHINRVVNGGSYINASNSSIEIPLREKIIEYCRKFHDIETGDITTVNDEKIDIFQQETPKQRVMALLKDMIAAGY